MVKSESLETIDRILRAPRFRDFRGKRNHTKDVSIVVTPESSPTQCVSIFTNELQYVLLLDEEFKLKELLLGEVCIGRFVEDEFILEEASYGESVLENALDALVFATDLRNLTIDFEGPKGNGEKLI